MQDFEEDDILSQSQQSRHEIMELLNKRQKDQEEADLENCFNQLKGQTNDEQRLNKLTDESIRDLVDMKDNISEYSLPDKKSDT